MKLEDYIITENAYEFANVGYKDGIFTSTDSVKIYLYFKLKGGPLKVTVRQMEDDLTHMHYFELTNAIKALKNKGWIRRDKASRYHWIENEIDRSKFLTLKKNMEKIHRQKMKANRAVHEAIKKGKIIRQPCEICGLEDSHGHHTDYTKVLDVIWLCASHHKIWHVEDDKKMQ